MPDVTPPATGPPRRLVTTGALGALAVGLAGCGIRLEDDAPRVPLVPTREPIPAEDGLVRLLTAVRAAAVAPLVTTDPLAPLLPGLHARQATVLHDALRQRGVPEDALTPSPSTTTTAAAPSPTPQGTSSPSGAPPASASPTASVTPAVRRSVADVESTILAAGTGLSGAEAELRPSLVALLGQAGAAVQLGAPGPTPATSPTPSAVPSSSPSPTSAAPPAWTSPSALVALVTATRRAVFLLEVAAARSPGTVRAAWLGDITTLQALTADLVQAAGDSAPPPDLAQTLPRPVTSPAEAATLATEATSALLASTGAALRSLTDGDPDAAFASVPGWLATVAATAHRHGTPLTAFPGLV